MKISLLLRRIALTASFLLAVAVLLWAMAAFSAWITRSQLDRDAAHRLHALRSGQPLWHWSPRTPDDFVAGRAFGTAELLQGVDGVDSVSGNGTPYEVGLPLDQPIDLRHWAILRIRAKSSAPGSLGISWANTDNQHCLMEIAAALLPTTVDITIDLRRLSATDATGEPCALPTAVTGFRLRPVLPAGASWLLKDAFLQAASPISPPSQTTLTLTGGLAQASAQWKTSLDHSAVPWVRLPIGATSETQLELRDQILARQPGAVIIAGESVPVAAAPWLLPPWLGWAACAVYLAVLLSAASFRLREGWVLGLILLGPLWLIAGLQWQLHPSVPALVGFLAAIGFALWRERKQVGAWRWFGPDLPSWLWPLALIVVAYALVIVLGGHRFKPLPWRHVLVYLGWASLQQWLMLVVVARRFEAWRWPVAVSAMVIALIFALLHTPNGILMQLCFLAEIYWAWCFMRSRCLAPIALAHATCALLVEAGLTGPLLRSLEISGRFFL